MYRVESEVCIQSSSWMPWYLWALNDDLILLLMTFNDTQKDATSSNGRAEHWIQSNSKSKEKKMMRQASPFWENFIASVQNGTQEFVGSAQAEPTHSRAMFTYECFQVKTVKFCHVLTYHLGQNAFWVTEMVQFENKFQNRVFKKHSGVHRCPCKWLKHYFFMRTMVATPIHTVPTCGLACKLQHFQHLVFLCELSF